LKLPKLHNQILIALIAGAMFGSVFNVEPDTLVLNYEGRKEIIRDWDEFIFITDKKDSVTFDKNAQLEIISFYKKNKSLKTINSYVKNFKNTDGEIKSDYFPDITSVSKESTIATSIKWIGDIFIRLLMMIAIPLVLASLTAGAASLGDIKKFARIGGKTIAFYLVTTAVAISIGLAMANIIQPGKQVDSATKERMLAVYSEDVSSKIEQVADYDLINMIVNLVPRNPLKALADGEMLQIVFFSLILGLVLSLIAKEKAEPVLSFFNGLSDAMIKLVDIIMLIAPLGVFALIAATVSEFGFNILQTLIWYMSAVLLGLLIHTVGTYSLIVKIFSRIKFKSFFKGMRKAQAIAFSTSSSAATLPVNMECVEENLGVSKSVASFVLPLGATINMDGTALYQGVAAVFIAQVFAIELTLVQQLTIVITATLASIGTAPVPGVGIIMLVIILKAVGIPEEGIALILGVDRILDMCRTVTNITGDASIAVAIASTENEISELVAVS
jgi:proton glutamate symport protein